MPNGKPGLWGGFYAMFSQAITSSFLDINPKKWRNSVERKNIKKWDDFQFITKLEIYFTNKKIY